ncbi:NADP-dependent oxidoreductase [Rhodococcus sp. LB1]|uniref:NADP-dependent oxidoreductase n=1 Tax=Rhodococcus sp. LB1 TaxID=1807499 RepID=UPI00077B1923|nr:NADP-dependent oxidoreductase [Rhodococcus sp. LB1]KXX54213.1 hypothetical protein AZG88_25135 [Rhodococcus sp. LB1]
MPYRAQYSKFGGPEVIEIVEVPKDGPGAGEVSVRVVAAGLNPVDYKTIDRSAWMIPVSLPAGVGNDLAGVVDAVGDGVTRFAVGDAVYGRAPQAALAEFAVTPASNLLPKPAGLSFVTASALPTAGRAAAVAVRTLGLTARDTVLVSSAAGGVGIIAAQLAKLSGAVVVGSASNRNHELLSGLGVLPVMYGEGLVDRITTVAPQGITAALDTHGVETIDAAIALGVPKERIVTVAAHGDDTRGTVAVRSMNATSDDVTSLVRAVAEGDVVLPIETVHGLDELVTAYTTLRMGHVRGKIVVVVSSRKN